MNHPRPENPRIIRNGTTIPLELIFAGTDDDGIAIWVATTMWRDGDVFKADVIPARTKIQFTTEEIR